MSGAALRHFLIPLVLAGGLIVPGRADSPDDGAASWHNTSFKAYQAQLGVGSSVSAIVQTRDGYLWIGTESGLARFDGLKFTRFPTSSTPGFSGHSVRCLHEDAHGDLWVATESELVRRRDGVFERIGPAGFVVTAIADNANGLWLGTHGQGLFRWDGHALRAAPADAALDGANIAALAPDGDGGLWIGLQNRAGLWRWHDGQAERFQAPGANALGSVRSLAGGAGGPLWIGSARPAVFRWSGGSLTHYSGGAIGLHGPVWSVCLARDGGVWVLANDLFRIRGAADARLERVTTIPSDYARQVLEDAEGNLWLAAKPDGLIRVRRVPVAALATAEERPADAARTVAEDPAGNVWVTTEHEGVLCVNPQGGVRRFPNVAEGEPHDLNGAPTAVPMRDGSVWVRFSGAVRVWRDGAWTTLPGSARIRSVYQDREGRIWAGEEPRGLALFRDGQFAELRLASGDPVPSVPVCFAENSAGVLYVGTWSAGVYVVENGRVSRAPALPTEEVRALHIDREDRVWAGLRSRGLALLQDGRWLNPEALSESVGHHVMAVADDAFGRLWIGTLGGIRWAPKDEIVAAAGGAAPAPHWHQIAMPGSAQPAPILTGVQPIVWPARDGRLLFATRRGVVAVDTGAIAADAVPPPVRVEAVTADGAVLPTERVEVPPHTRQLAIAYTTPSFTQPGALRFRYRLDGFDPDWIDAGNRREAIYTNLPPGRYAFHVSAANADGVWGPAGDTTEFAVRPGLWQRTSVQIALFLAMALIGAVTVRTLSQRRLRRAMAELERKAAVDRERARIAKDIHDDLGGSLTELNLLLALIQRDPGVAPAAAGHAERARAVTQQAIKSMDETVWAVNPGNDTLPHLIDYVGQFAVEFLAAAGIRGRLELPEHPPVLPVPADVRHNVFLIIKEALNNCVRHGDATEARVRLRLGCGLMEVEVEDDGCGIRGNVDRASADGLRNMRLRTEAVGGRFLLASRAGGGTTVRAEIPLPGLHPDQAAPPGEPSLPPALPDAQDASQPCQ